MTEREWHPAGWILAVAALCSIGGGLTLVPLPRVEAQVRTTPKNQSPPASEWPQGWKLTSPTPRS